MYLITYQFGNGIEQTVADAPVLSEVNEGDEEINLNWTAPAYTGYTPITAYNVYKQPAGNNPVLLVSLGPDILTYTDSAVGNGVQYYYSVVAVNAIGASANSNSAAGIPYGDCSVDNVVMNSKTLQMTFKPNGRAIEKIFIVALDANPSEDDEPSNCFYEVPTGSISQAVTGTFNLSKTFSSFSVNITFYCVICNNANSSAYLKSA